MSPERQLALQESYLCALGGGGLREGGRQFSQGEGRVRDRSGDGLERLP